MKNKQTKSSLFFPYEDGEELKTSSFSALLRLQ